MKVIAACLVVGVGVYWGAAEAKTYLWPTPPVAVVEEVAPQPAIASLVVPNATPDRVINALTIEKAVPETGKFIAADLVEMKVFLYEDKQLVATYPIQTKGRPGTPWETPSGFYSIQTKEESHFSSIGKVVMPYSMQFYGNYFLHGWPYYPDGTPVASSYSGGCIRMTTEDAEKVFAFAKRGTPLFVYDPKNTEDIATLTLDVSVPPKVTAQAYAVVDIDTGDVYAEHNADKALPIASITTLMTALVANETISFERNMYVPRAALSAEVSQDDTTIETFVVEDLLYPLLLNEVPAIARPIAQTYGENSFVNWMNAAAKAHSMSNTQFADASGNSAETLSTPDDVYRLLRYLSNKKSFIFGITRKPTATIEAEEGSEYKLTNTNGVISMGGYLGGRVGFSEVAGGTAAAVQSVTVQGEKRRVAFVVLGAEDSKADLVSLSSWFATALEKGGALARAACVSCAEPSYRTIEE